MKIVSAIILSIITLNSCENSTDRQLEKLKQENFKLKKSLDSLTDSLKHSLVIHENDVLTHFGALSFNGQDTIDSKSDFHIDTYLFVVKLPDDFKVKWKIDQKGGIYNPQKGGIYNPDGISKSIIFQNLKPGKHTFTGSYEIYFHGKQINRNDWQNTVYVKK